MIYRVWLPRKDEIVRLRDDQLRPLDDRYARIGPNQIAFIAAASRVADALTHDLFAGRAGVLLAPIESSVIPLPHQIRALSRAMSNDRVRYLLTDEVESIKTIEAGLIMRELKLRSLLPILIRLNGERQNG